MSTLLEQAIAEIAKLPESEQDRFAKWLLEEIASERRWDHAFAGSAAGLAQLGEEALREHRQGQTKPFTSGES